MISIIITHLVIRLIFLSNSFSIFFFQIIFSPNIISARMNFYLIHLVPETAHSWHTLALFLLKLSLVVIVVLTLAGSFRWTISITSSSRVKKSPWNPEPSGASIGFKGHRTALSRILHPVLPSTRTLFHASENLYLGLSGGEYDCNCGPGSRQTCLVRWPTGKDVIWHANINITAQEVLYNQKVNAKFYSLFFLVNKRL